MTIRPLRIAMISYYLPSGSKIGVGYQVHQLANEMVRRGHRVQVYSECPPVSDANYGHSHVRLSGSMRTFRFANALRRRDFDQFDVLHAHGDDYWMWKRRARAHVRTLHGSCFEEALRIHGFLQRLRMFALGCSEVLASIVADATVVVSPRTRRWTPWVHDVIPNGVDTRTFHPELGSQADRPVILFVGTWAGRKRGSMLASAFIETVLPEIPDAELWMVSQDLPSDHHLAIHAFGQVTNEQLRTLYRRAWVFCLPSSYEGFGIPYVEAMASGLPVIATRNIGARYVTDEGRDGVLVNPKEIGEALIELLRDSHARATISARGLERAQYFSLERIADQYEDLYRRTIARQHDRNR